MCPRAARSSSTVRPRATRSSSRKSCATSWKKASRCGKTVTTPSPTPVTPRLASPKASATSSVNGSRGCRPSATDRADLAKAVEYGELAAQRATSVYAYAEAASHLERCLAVQEILDPDDKAKRCSLLLRLGEAMIPSGEPLRAAEGAISEAYEI